MLMRVGRYRRGVLRNQSVAVLGRTVVLFLSPIVIGLRVLPVLAILYGAEVTRAGH
jgi:hypothetical protein